MGWRRSGCRATVAKGSQRHCQLGCPQGLSGDLSSIHQLLGLSFWCCSSSAAFEWKSHGNRSWRAWLTLNSLDLFGWLVYCRYSDLLGKLSFSYYSFFSLILWGKSFGQFWDFYLLLLSNWGKINSNKIEILKKRRITAGSFEVLDNVHKSGDFCLIALATFLTVLFSLFWIWMETKSSVIISMQFHY